MASCGLRDRAAHVDSAKCEMLERLLAELCQGVEDNGSPSIEQMHPRVWAWWRHQKSRRVRR